MTAFPSGVTNNVNTSNLDSATDQPKNARADLLTLTQRVNQMINSFNANSGICGLNAQGKVDSAKLIAQIDTAQLATDAVNGDKIEDNAVDSEHIANGAVDFDHISFGSTATNLGGATPANNVVPTQAAVKTYVDAEVSATPDSLSGLNTGWVSLGSTSASGTASSDGFIVAQAEPASSDDTGGIRVTVAGQNFYSEASTYNFITITIPIAKGDSYSVGVYYARNASIKFKGFSYT